jgi:hypothetical protein
MHRHPGVLGMSAWVLLLGCALWLAGSTAPAAAASLQVRLEFSESELSFDRVEGYDLVALTDGSLLSDVARPALPVRQVRVALPRGASIAGLSVTDARTIDLPGAFMILPAQPPIRTSQAAAAAFVEPDRAAYASDALYPAEVARFVRETDLAGQAMAVIEVMPLQYLAAENRLVFTTALTLQIETRDGYVCGDYLPSSSTPVERERYESDVRSMVANPDDVQLCTASGAATRATLEPGDYDYVIIASADLAPSLQTLAQWKTKKGVPAKVVTTAWVYGQYSGTNDAKIRAFISDANQQWGAIYFLLGGDVDKVPTNLWATTIDPYNVVNDTYYADFDGDWTMEVSVGRATGRYGLYMDIFTNKVLTYEKNPPLTGYARQAGLFGFDLDPSTPCEVCKTFVENNYFPSGWEITHVYDSQTTDHKQAALAAIESGLNLINHIDHADVTIVGLGSSHDAWLTSVDVNAFTNTDDQSIWYSTGCKAVSYDLTCIAEDFCKNADGGVLAYIGNSEFGWYNTGACNTLSNLYDRLFFSSLFTFGKTTLGPCFIEHKNRHFPVDETERYIVKELTLLGDPELPIWTDDPGSLAVTHPATLSAGAISMTVHVESAAGTHLSGARVCLMKDAELYLVGLTNTNGDATFDPSAATPGTLDVTVTAHNYLPSETTLEVTEGGADVEGVPGAPAAFALHAVRPNPARAATMFAFDLPAPAAATLRILDPAGRIVRTLADGGSLAAGTHRVNWDGRDAAGSLVPSGVYFYRLETNTDRATRQMIVVR